MEEKISLNDSFSITLKRGDKIIDKRGSYSISKILEEVCKIFSNIKG